MVRIRIRVSVGIRVSLVSVVRIFRRPTRLWLCRKAVKFVSGERISLQYIYEHMPRLQAAARGKKNRSAVSSAQLSFSPVHHHHHHYHYISRES